MKRRVLLAALILGALGMGFSFWRASRHPGVETRVLLLDTAPGQGMTSEETQVLGLLIADALETRGDLAITTLPDLPQPFQPVGPLLVLRPKASRAQDDLRLDLEWAQMGPGRDGAWHRAEPQAQAPASALRAALAALPLRLGPVQTNLLPRRADAFWALLDAEGAAFTNRNLDAALTRVTALAQAEPRCAVVQAALAQLGTVRMLQNPNLLDGHADRTLEAADQALAAEPGYPRALRYASRLLADEGRQDDALTRVQEGLKLHPHSLPLLFAVDYAARTAGLLDLALGARRRMEALWGGSPVPPPTGFTYLYAGQFEAFEASFRRLPGAAPDGFDAFNRGYAALVRQRPEEAAAAFQITEQDVTAEAQFRALAKVFRFQIEGRTADARLALNDLEQSRLGLQVPDGEFTFTMAEAAAFLGEEGFAMDLAQQASGQGFLCSAWYRGSPFLRSLQPLPRWQAILQHVDARSARLARRHTPSDFDL